MTYLDRLLQSWRIREAAVFISPGDQVLDIGTADGALFRIVRGVGDSVGLDPDLDMNRMLSLPGVKFYRGQFPEALPGPMNFDIITMLAVLEHIPPDGQAPLAMACASHLKPGGKLVITVPSPAVDQILAVLLALRLVHGMSVEQHYGFETRRVPELFSNLGLVLVTRRRFQCGLNNLFVFQRSARAASDGAL